jgi:hypothetical protein
MKEKFNEMKKKCPMFIKPDLFLIGEVFVDSAYCFVRSSK